MDNFVSYFLTLWSMSPRSSTLLIALVSAHCFNAPLMPPKSLGIRQTTNPNKYRSDIPVKGLQYIAYTIREVFFDKTVCLTRLSNINNDARDVREFLHHSIPFFFVLLHFLFKRVVNTGDVYKESDPKRTPRI